MPKSEMTSRGESHIRFSCPDGTLVFERNIGQASFTHCPHPRTDTLLVAVDGEEWFLSKADARRLRDWLNEALA